MSEKVYAYVLYFLAPHFYRVYGEEARRLVRDRCRDEQGVVSKIRLWLDLLADLIVAAIRDARFTSEALHSRMAAAHAMKAVPSFAVVRSGWPPTAALLVGGAFSLGILATLSALIDYGGRREVVSLPLHGIVQFSDPTRATSKGSHINEQTRSPRAHLFGAPTISALFGDAPLSFKDAGMSADEARARERDCQSARILRLPERRPANDKCPTCSRKE